MAYDKLGIWHDSANGRFARKGWSSARALAWKLVRGFQTRDRIRGDGHGKARLFDDRLKPYGLFKGDVVDVEFVDDGRGRVKVSTGGRTRSFLVPWDRFDDTYRPRKKKRKKSVRSALRPLIVGPVAPGASQAVAVKKVTRDPSNPVAFLDLGTHSARLTLRDVPDGKADALERAASELAADGQFRIMPALDAIYGKDLYSQWEHSIKGWADDKGLTDDDFAAWAKARLASDTADSVLSVGPHSVWARGWTWESRREGFVQGPDGKVSIKGMYEDDQVEADGILNDGITDPDVRFAAAAVMVSDWDSFVAAESYVHVDNDGIMHVGDRSIPLADAQPIVTRAGLKGLVDHLYPPEMVQQQFGFDIPVVNPDRPDRDGVWKRVHLGRALPDAQAFVAVDDDGVEVGAVIPASESLDLSDPDVVERLRRQWDDSPVSQLTYRMPEGERDPSRMLASFLILKDDPGRWFEVQSDVLGDRAGVTGGYRGPLAIATPDGTADILAESAGPRFPSNLWRDRATGDIYSHRWINGQWEKGKEPLFRATTDDDVREIIGAWKAGVRPADYQEFVDVGGTVGADGKLHFGDESFHTMDEYRAWKRRQATTEVAKATVATGDVTPESFGSTEAFEAAAAKLVHASHDTADSKVADVRIASNDWESTGEDLATQRAWMDPFRPGDVFDAALRADMDNLAAKGLTDPSDVAAVAGQRFDRLADAVGRERNTQLPALLSKAVSDMVPSALDNAVARDNPASTSQHVKASRKVLEDYGLPGDIAITDIPSAVMAKVRAEMGDEAYSAAIRDGLLDTQNGSWADSSQSSFSMASQRAAAELVGLDAETDFGDWFEWATDRADDHTYTRPSDFTRGEMAMARLSVLSTYTLTQHDLTERGVGPDDVLIVHRGSTEPSFEAASGMGVPTVWVGTNPLAATAVKPESAFSGVQLAMRVPRSRILSTAMTGPGTYKENEVVVIGDPDGYLAAVKRAYNSDEAVSLINLHLDGEALKGIPFANDVARLPESEKVVALEFAKPVGTQTMPDSIPKALTMRASVLDGDLAPAASLVVDQTNDVSAGVALADQVLMLANGQEDRYDVYAAAMAAIDGWDLDGLTIRRYDAEQGGYTNRPVPVEERELVRAAFKVHLMDLGVGVTERTGPLVTPAFRGKRLVYDGASGQQLDMGTGQLTSVPSSFRIVDADSPDAVPHPVTVRATTLSGRQVSGSELAHETAVPISELKIGDVAHLGDPGAAAIPGAIAIGVVAERDGMRGLVVEPSGEFRKLPPDWPVARIDIPDSGSVVTAAGDIVRSDGTVLRPPMVGPSEAIAVPSYAVVDSAKASLQAGEFTVADLDRWRASITNDEGDVFTPEQWIAGYILAGRGGWAGTFDEFKQVNMRPSVLAANRLDLRPSSSPDFTALRGARTFASVRTPRPGDTVDWPASGDDGPLKGTVLSATVNGDRSLTVSVATGNGTASRTIGQAELPFTEYRVPLPVSTPAESIKKASTLQVGDRVRGDDGQVHDVLNVTTGDDGAITVVLRDYAAPSFDPDADVTVVSSPTTVPVSALRRGDVFSYAAVGEKLLVLSDPTPGESASAPASVVRIKRLDSGVTNVMDQFAGLSVRKYLKPQPGDVVQPGDLTPGVMVDMSTLPIAYGARVPDGVARVVGVKRQASQILDGAKNAGTVALDLRLPDRERPFTVYTAFDGGVLVGDGLLPNEKRGADVHVGDRVIVDGHSAKVADMGHEAGGRLSLVGEDGEVFDAHVDEPVQVVLPEPELTDEPVEAALNSPRAVKAMDVANKEGMRIAGFDAETAGETLTVVIEPDYNPSFGALVGFVRPNGKRKAVRVPPTFLFEQVDYGKITYDVTDLKPGWRVDIPGGPKNATITSVDVGAATRVHYEVQGGPSGTWTGPSTTTTAVTWDDRSTDRTLVSASIVEQGWRVDIPGGPSEVKVTSIAVNGPTVTIEYAADGGVTGTWTGPADSGLTTTS